MNITFYSLNDNRKNAITKSFSTIKTINGTMIEHMTISDFECKLILKFSTNYNFLSKSTLCNYASLVIGRRI